MGDSTMDVRSHYHHAAFDLSACFKEAADHIAAELEFMYILVSLEIEALNNNQTDFLPVYMDRQNLFLEKQEKNLLL